MRIIIKKTATIKKPIAVLLKRLPTKNERAKPNNCRITPPSIMAKSMYIILFVRIEKFSTPFNLYSSIFRFI